MKIKRFLSIVLTLAMLLGMFPGMSLTASAADTTTTITSPATTGTMTITLTIAAASVKTAPEANTLTYSGSAQTLTTTGEAGVGTLQYQLGESATTEPTGTWGTTVPQGTEAKDYYVWYRSRVNDNNISTAGCKTVTIAKASITNATVTLSDTSLVYIGSEQSVTVSSVKLGDTTLTADTDYEVTSGTTGTAKNTYTVTVTGKGNYKDTATAQWSIGLATPTIETFPTASAITYGQKLADSTLTGGVAKLGDTTVAGTFAWKNTETKPAVSDSNATEYDVVFTPTDSDNYAAVECKVKLTVNKAVPTVTAPTAKTLTYTGSAQALVNAGEATGGTMQYAIGDANGASQPYTTSIPAATDAGTYYVWYKVVGDSNHLDSNIGCVTVTIATADSSDSGSGSTSSGSTDSGSGSTSSGSTDSGSGSTSSGSTDSGSGSSSSSGSSDSGNTSGGTSSGSSDNTNTNTDTSAKVPYDDVATSTGSVNDITGTASATAESNPFGTKIENNSNLTTLLSLTDAEVAQGVNVWLDIQDMSASVSQTDKTLIQNTSGDYTVGLYLDINLFKKVGSNDATKVTETNGKVKASIVIPESLWKSGRTFEIIRVHDGVATAIAGTYDENTHVFTFETDKFSTYALAYKDPASSSDSGTTSDSSSSSDSGSSNSSNSTQSTAPKTGDPNDIRVWYLLLIASLGGLGFLGFQRRRKTN